MSTDPQRIKAKYTIYVNFSKHIDSVRFTVMRNSDRKIILTTKCAHGNKSGTNYATTFSNSFDSHQTSLGKYVIMEKYNGMWGRSFKLDGLDKINSNARSRSIIIHSAKKLRTKWSWGCFAIPEQDLDKLYSLDLYGSILIAYK